MASISDDGPGGLMARRLLPVAILTPIVAAGFSILALRGRALRRAVRLGGPGDGRDRRLRRLHLAERRIRSTGSTRNGGGSSRSGSRESSGSASWPTSMPQIVWLARPDGEIEYFNHRWFDYTGQDPGDGWDWRPVLHPDDLGPCLELWGRASSLGRELPGRIPLPRADGAYRWHLARAEPMRDEAGQIVQWIGTCTDIDDQKRASEQRYRSLVEATTAIVWNTPASAATSRRAARLGAFTGQTFEQLRAGAGSRPSTPTTGRDARVWSAAVASGRSTRSSTGSGGTTASIATCSSAPCHPR